MMTTAFPRRSLAKLIGAFTGARVLAAEGDSPPQLPEQAIYYANHSSHLDFLTIWAALPPDLQNRARPVAAKDYWGSGLRKIFAEQIFNAYLVDRHGASGPRRRRSHAGVSPKGQITGMSEVLAAGDSLIIFPEGTRGDGETIAEFHGGLYKLAQCHPEVPVVPVTLANLGRILPKGELIPVPHLSTVVFCAPIQLAAEESQQVFLTRARQILVECLAEHQAIARDAADDATSPGAPPRQDHP
ncbi:lysophospholipid acyltransferase family protein [Nesterenkonia sphaerica]|uniref:1-acyl-sn-glycerol-3-phosphate acyltransferase n=1 Tax=Nesterenkonia sphaerica TaxID=1804988 RepID=A0A5R9A626_9MICC|nr:lysophospholipid acyltransferase family protein [Nesterenkonia sphaerica]TLP73256.1 1-acyl-sn-glycerol-3-phosphate acyltransferase [Nesterenkonia sphaerica]